MAFPTVLIFLLFLMPVITSSHYNGNTLLTNRKIFPKQQPLTSYAVIFDAGSTGTRLHVFNFDHNLDLLRIGNDLEFTKKVKPGLSSYAAVPKQAAESLVPLLRAAEDVVPEDLHPSTPVKLGATAGLRLLDEDAAENILQAVRDLFKNRSTLNVQSDAVGIIDGTQEGSYLWVAVNYLLGKLGNKFPKTVGVVDFGGASVQMTYAVSRNTAKNAPKVPFGEDPYIKKLVVKGKRYDLYVHSYLRYGKEASRAENLKITYGSANPCILAGYVGTFKYSGVEYPVFAPNSGPRYDACRKIVLKVLKVNAPCAHPNCTFNGVWDGGKGSGQTTLYATSSFYYLSEDSGIIKPGAPNGIIRPVDFKNVAKRACGLSYEESKFVYPRFTESKRPFICMDSSYHYALLVDGFGLDPLQEITVADKIQYQDALVETAWPLGTAIEAISALPKFHPLMYFI